MNGSPAKNAQVEAQNDYIIGLFTDNNVFQMVYNNFKWFT